MGATEITAIAAALVTVGGGAIKFVWDKIEKRFEAVEERFKAAEKRLDECREDRDLSEKRRSILITIIEVLKQEFHHHLPKSTALARADELMDEYRSLKPADREG